MESLPFVESSPARCRGHSLGDDKEMRILTAAAHLFAKQGIRKTTVEDVAREASLGKGTIYLYFKSKDAIFATVVRREFEQLWRRLREVVLEQGPLADRLRRYLEMRVRYFDEVVKKYELSYEILREQRHQPVLQTLREHMRAEESQIIQVLLRDGSSKGDFSVCDLVVTSVAITAMIAAVEEDWIYIGHRMCADDKVQILTQLLLQGLMRRA